MSKLQAKFIRLEFWCKYFVVMHSYNMEIDYVYLFVCCTGGYRGEQYGQLLISWWNAITFPLFHDVIVILSIWTFLAIFAKEKHVSSVDGRYWRWMNITYLCFSQLQPHGVPYPLYYGSFGIFEIPVIAVPFDKLPFYWSKGWTYWSLGDLILHHTFVCFVHITFIFFKTHLEKK